MADKQNDGGKLQRYAKVGKVFTPGAPINRYALFAGRREQIMSVVDAINQRGQHVVLYGERGVGKTSLANVLSELFYFEETGEPLAAAKINCNTNDDFYSLWSKVFRELNLKAEFEAEWRERPPEPEDVRYLLRERDDRLLIVIDEFDRLEDQEAVSLLADTIKTLSDHSIGVTLVIVGVADSIDELIGDHRSVERALSQIPMQRMSISELEQIVDTGLEEVGVSITEDARQRIARLSEGLPFYTHLLALHSAQTTVMDDRNEVTRSDVERAIGRAVEKAQHSIQTDYRTAVRSTRKESQFEQALLACALAPKDELGYFTTRAVREPMSKIMGKPRDIGSFNRNLKKFTEESHGCVLHTSGQSRRRFYRFTNPMLEPFVILNGVSKGLISEELLQELQDQARGQTGDDGTLSLGV